MRAHTWLGSADHDRHRTIETVLRQCQRIGVERSHDGVPTPLIPQLSTENPREFAMTVVTVDGHEYSVGSHKKPFSIQSIVKLFSLIALLQIEPDPWGKVGWRATAEGFRSFAELEKNDLKPINPFVNAGALRTEDILLTNRGPGSYATLNLIRKAAGNPTIIQSTEVAASELEHSETNLALTHLLAAGGNLDNDTQEVLEQYVFNCAIEASTSDLAHASLLLASEEASLTTLSPEQKRRTLAAMTISGMYERSDDFHFFVGLPAKSGISGGVLAIAPGFGTICAWSPPLDEAGNSPGAIAAIANFVRTLSGA